MMAGRGTFVSIALAFAMVLLNVSVCTCDTVTYSSEIDALNQTERYKVYSVLRDMVYNDVVPNERVQPDRKYYAGRLFTKYIDLDKKAVVVRLTRWTNHCSVSMSSSDTSKGSELLEAWQNLLPAIKSYLVGEGHKWVAASSRTDWIDYYVIKERPPLGAPSLGSTPPNADAASYKSVSDVGSSVTDCPIQPSMLLSHDSGVPLSQLRPGDYLLSPDGNYKLIVPGPPIYGAPCVAYLVDTRDGSTKWRSNSSWPQGDCRLAFRTDGALELWKDKNRIWSSPSACAIEMDCAGAASLAFKDGDVKLYRSVDDHLSPYWST